MRWKWACLVLILVAELAFVACRRTTLEEIQATTPVERQPLEVVRSDWPWWRGIERNAHATEPLAEINWNRDPIVWKVTIPGRGHASPTVLGNQIFIATALESERQQRLLCYERNTGQLLWDVLLHEGDFLTAHPKNSQASATPATDGQRVYTAMLSRGALWVTAVDLDGNIVWQQEAGPFTSQHGYGSSPVVHGALVLVAGDNEGAGFVAGLDRATGELVWRVRREDIPSYATPTVAELAGKTQLLLSGQNQLVSYEPQTGEQLWSSEGPAETTANTVATYADLVIATGGFPQSRVMAVRADGSGEVVWSHPWKLYVPSPLVIGERLLIVHDNGVVRYLEASTGKSLWHKRLDGDFTSSPVLAGEQVYVPNERGMFYVFRTEPKFELVAEYDLHEPCFASPVISGGQLLIRTERSLVCLGRAEVGQE